MRTLLRSCPVLFAAIAFGCPSGDGDDAVQDVPIDADVQVADAIEDEGASYTDPGVCGSLVLHGGDQGTMAWPDAGTSPECPFEGDDGSARHGCCEEPAVCPLPVVPRVNMDDGGRPLFDSWRDVACEDAASLLCTGESSNCWPHTCFPLAWSGEGVCAYPDGDSSCDGEGEAVGYGGGHCVFCLPPESLAAACCAGLDGVDCRAWPFPADGKPGMICARHEDCEPGLICGPAWGTGYGICQCPEHYHLLPSPAPGVCP